MKNENENAKAKFFDEGVEACNAKLIETLKTEDKKVLFSIQEQLFQIRMELAKAYGTVLAIQDLNAKFDGFNSDKMNAQVSQIMSESLAKLAQLNTQALFQSIK